MRQQLCPRQVLFSSLGERGADAEPAHGRRVLVHRHALPVFAQVDALYAAPRHVLLRVAHGGRAHALERLPDLNPASQSGAGGRLSPAATLLPVVMGIQATRHSWSAVHVWMGQPFP
jgi:hypothetical protein